MARARNLKPSFFTNDLLAEINPLGRLLFQGLWCVADREGRLEDRPKKLKAELLPYDDCNVDDLLKDLSKHGFIIRYKANKTDYIQVLNFTKHQNPHVKEADSIIPAPEENGACLVLEQCEQQPEPERAGLIPSSLNPLPSSTPKGGDDRFEKFWKAYPRKQGKGAAEKAWIKAHINGSFDSVLTALEGQKRSEQWKKDNGQFVPNPATWLNQRRWEDEIPGGNHSDGTSSTNDIFRGVL